jgi:hypothetical protein
MGWRSYRRQKLLPSVSINWSKRGPSVSLGRRGAHFTVGPCGTRETVGIPGTGVSYTTTRFRLWSSLAVLIVVATIVAAIIAIVVVYGWQ